MSLAEVETATQSYRAARETLTARVEAMNHEIEKIKRRKMPGIKTAVAAANDARSQLERTIDANRDQFASPKTLVISGIRIGLVKGKGKIVYDSETAVVDRIKRLYPEDADGLIKVTEKPVRKALERLPSADLKRLGCTVEETDDQIVIKPTDGETDKIVSALLRDAEQSDSDESAAQAS